MRICKSFGDFHFDLGWFSGEPLVLLDIDIMKTHWGGNRLDIFNFQIAKFCFYLGVYI